MADFSLHTGDHGLWLLVAEGGTLDWAAMDAAELRLGRPDRSVLIAAPADLMLDRAASPPCARWRPQPGDLTLDGIYTLQMLDVTAGRSVVVVDRTFSVVRGLAPPPP